MHVKKGIQVKIISGKDKGKTGEIIEMDRTSSRAIVKGINMVKKHLKTTKEKKGRIISKEKLNHISKLTPLSDTKKKKEVKKWFLDLKNFTKLKL